MNTINFWTPICYEGNPNCREALTEAVDNYFSIDCRVAVIDKTNQDQARFIDGRASRLSTALKIITYITIIIPLIVFVAKLILRCCMFKSPPIYQFPPRAIFGPINQPPAPIRQPPALVGQPRHWDPKEKIEQKLDLTLRAFEVFKEKRAELVEVQPNLGWSATANEVNDYFETIIQKLKANENVPIPMYYHATRNNVDDIARTNNLGKSMHGSAGPAVYLSTRDEHYCPISYGDYTYAIDPDAVEHLPALYFGGRMSNHLGEEGGLWIAVQSDVALSGENVAHIAVPDQQSKENLTEKFWQGDKDSNGGIEFYAPIITRAASDWIRQSYTVVHRHPLPIGWHRRTPFDNVPNHVIEQTQQRPQRM